MNIFASRQQTLQLQRKMMRWWGMEEAPAWLLRCCWSKTLAGICSHGDKRRVLGQDTVRQLASADIYEVQLEDLEHSQALCVAVLDDNDAIRFGEQLVHRVSETWTKISTYCVASMYRVGD